MLLAGSVGVIGGLIIGVILGAMAMFYAYTGMTPTVRDNLIAGAAMGEARDTVNSPAAMMDEPALVEENPERPAP